MRPVTLVIFTGELQYSLTVWEISSSGLSHEVILCRMFEVDIILEIYNHDQIENKVCFSLKRVISISDRVWDALRLALVFWKALDFFVLMMILVITFSFGDCMHSTSQIINILRGDSCHRNTPIFGQINTEVLRYFFNLKNTYWIRIVKTYLFIIDMGPCDLNGIAPKGRHIRILVTCSGFMPVKQNIPIWSVICSQLCVDPSRIKPSFNFLRIVIIRSAITLTSPSLKV